MYCKQCGKQNKDDARFCVFCGTDLVNSVSEPSPYQKKGKKRNNTALILIISVTVFLILFSLIISALFIFKKTKDEKDDREEIIQEEEMSESDVLDSEVDLETGRPDGEEVLSNGAVSNLQVSVGEVYDSYYDEQHMEMLISSEVSKVVLASEYAEAFPELSKTLQNRNVRVVDTMKQEYEQARLDAISHIQETPEMFYSYEMSEIASVRRADTNVLSLLITGYGYYGGNHGTTYFKSENYDTKTGKLLKLTDVVSDVNVLPDLIMEAFTKSGEVEELFPDIDLHDYLNDLQRFVWTVDYNGITFFFGSYEIASYAAGTQTATISFAEHPELVKDPYQEVPDGYAIHLTEYEYFYYDINNDGVLDSLYTCGITGDNNDRDVISINGMDYEFLTDWENSFNEAVFIHNTDGKNYLYISVCGYSDDYIMNIYAFENDSVFKRDTMGDTFWYHSVNATDDCYYEAKITDPQFFKLGTGTDLLSTVSGYKTYSVDANGIPVSDDIGYMFKENDSNEYLYFTVKQSVTADVIVKDTGEVTGQKTLTPGTRVYYYRTDGLTYGDLILDDDTIVRVYVDSSDWPVTINGINIEEIFDGLFWAG